MEKIASQMLDKLKAWVDENPDLVKTTLLTSGLGAAAAAALTGKESDHERTSTRVKRRLKNALFGALAAGGSVGLLHYAANNFSNAKLKNAPTPEEEFTAAAKEVGKDASKLLTNGWTLTGAGAVGAYKGLKNSWKKTNDKARNILSALKREGIPLVGEVPKAKDAVDSVAILNNKSTAAGIRNFVARLDNSAVSAAADQATNTGDDIAKTLKALTGSHQNKDVLKEIRDLVHKERNSGRKAALSKLRKMILDKHRDTSSNLSKLTQQLTGHTDAVADLIKKNPGSVSFTKPEFIKSLRMAGFDHAAGIPASMKSRIWEKLLGLGQRNWRAGAGAAAAAGGTAGLGWLLNNLSADN